jgi:hypothetical protein
MDFGIDIWNLLESLAVSFAAMAPSLSIIIRQDATTGGGQTDTARSRFDCAVWPTEAVGRRAKKPLDRRLSLYNKQVI